MTLDEQYAEACYGAKIRFLTVDLLPMTLGHFLLLTNLRCRLLPWVTGFGSASDADAILAAHICSRGWRQGERSCNSMAGPWRLRWLGFLWRLCRGKLIMRARMVRYFRIAHTSRPNTSMDPNKTTAIAGSVLAFWFSRLSSYGFTHDQIKDMPVAVVEWEKTHMDAREQVVNIRAEETNDFDAFTRQVQEELEATALKDSGRPQNWRRKVL